MSRNAPVPRLPYFLLGAMTLVSFGGPFAVFLVMRGGLRPDWPPDRLIEWIVVGLVIALAVALFVACLSVGWWYSWDRRAKRPDTSDPGPGPL
jgi:Na+-driven multidrug efflux pump